MVHYETVKSIFISQGGIAKIADITSKGIHKSKGSYLETGMCEMARDVFLCRCK